MTEFSGSEPLGEDETQISEELFQQALLKETLLAQHSIFDMVKGIQATLDLFSHPSFEELQKIARLQVAKLDRFTVDTGLMGQKVRLLGKNINKPDVDLEFESGSVRLTDKSLDACWDKMEEEGAISFEEERSVSGIFFGFGVRYVAPPEFDPNYDTAEEVRLKLRFQVRTGYTRTPNFSGDALADGDVMTSQLEFLADDDQKAAQEARQYFTTIHDRGLAAIIDGIDRSLSSEKDKYNLENLSEIAAVIEEILQEPDYYNDICFQDYLAKLIAGCLEITSREFQVVSSRIIKKNEDDIFMSGVASDKEPYYYQGSIKGVVYFPNGLNERIICFAVAQGEDAICFIPLSAVVEFQPVGYNAAL